MAVNVLPGMPVVVMRRNANPPRQTVGAVASVRGQAVAVRFATLPDASPGDEVFLVAGKIGERFAAGARFVAARDSIGAFQLVREWQPVDARSSPRYPADLRGELRSVLGASRQRATIIDVSAGGVGAEVATKPGGRELELQLEVGGFAACLPCEVVGSSASLRGVILHLRFLDMTPVQQAFIRNLIDHLGKLLDAASLGLAS